MKMAFKIPFLTFLIISISLSQEVKHKFLAVDNGKNKLLYVDEYEPTNNWTVSIPKGSRNIQLLGGDSVLVGHGNGCAIYNKKNGEKIITITDSKSGIQCAMRIPSGNYMLNNSNGTFYEIDAAGNDVKEIKISGVKSLRLARYLNNDRLLFTSTEAGKIIEADLNGKIVWEADIPSKGYKAIKLPNGNILATAGETAEIVEIDYNTKKCILTIAGESKNPGLGLDWFSGFDTLSNGNIVVANWLGHLKNRTGRPHLVEFSRDDKLVWKWGTQADASQITNVIVLDKGGTTEVKKYDFTYDLLRRHRPCHTITQTIYYSLSGRYLQNINLLRTSNTAKGIYIAIRDQNLKKLNKIR